MSRMYELIQVGENTYYVNCGAKIGIYRQGTEVYLIDSGNDKDAGRRVRKLLDEQGWTLKGIINTHSHADHTGGNQYLQKQYGCQIFAAGIECDMVNHPVLEPALLYGGRPFQDLRHKFLMAQESKAVDITSDNFPAALEVIRLGGHYFDQIGIRTPDDVIFLADCVCSEETLAKYQISYLYDVAEYLKTLDYVETLDARCFVPAHAPAESDVKALTERNREKVLEIAAAVQMLCSEGIDFETLLKAVFDRYGLTMTMEQYVLVGSTLRSYLSYLKDEGKVCAVIADNRLLWKSIHG